MPTELQSIDFGIKFVEGAFACRTDSLLNRFEKEQQKLLLTTYANTFGIINVKTDLLTIISLLPSYDLFLKLAEILLSIKKRMDAVCKPKQHFGSYFFIASAITLVDIAFISLIQQGFDRSVLEVNYPFLKHALDLSNSIGIKSPNISKDDYLNDDIQTIQESLKNWMATLRKYASKGAVNETKNRLVFRGVLKGIPYLGPAIDALFFGKD